MPTYGNFKLNITFSRYFEQIELQNYAEMFQQLNQEMAFIKINYQSVILSIASLLSEFSKIVDKNNSRTCGFASNAFDMDSV